MSAKLWNWELGIWNWDEVCDILMFVIGLKTEFRLQKNRLRRNWELGIWNWGDGYHF
jgi:hypothetical protein